VTTANDIPRGPLAAIAREPWRWAPHTFAHHASGGRWRPYTHLQVIGERIADAVAAGGGRIIVNCPPRHGKSELISHWTPTWMLDSLPASRVILCSYESGIATGWGRIVRNEFEGNDRLRTSLRADSRSAHRWHTPEGGGMIAAGVGGPISGIGGDLLIVDDPVKNWQEAYSGVYRTRLVDWFLSTFTTRAEPGATIIVVMTRWHVDDLTGYLLAEHGQAWTVLSMPATAGGSDLLGRAPGEALCPQRYDRAALAGIRSAVGAQVWEALYQQQPRALGSGRVYENFSDANVDGSADVRDDLPLHVSVDFNISPGMHVEIGQYDEAADVFVVVDELHGPRMNVRGAMDALSTWIERRGGFRWPELHVFGDASGRNEWAGTGESDYDIVRQKLEGLGLPHRLRVPRANPPVKDRINTINEALCDVDERVHYRVHPRCERLIDDFRKLKTDESGLIDKRDRVLSHASDAEGYRVHYLRPLRRPLRRAAGRFSVRAGA